MSNFPVRPFAKIVDKIYSSKSSKESHELEPLSGKQQSSGAESSSPNKGETSSSTKETNLTSPGDQPDPSNSTNGDSSIRPVSNDNLKPSTSGITSASVHFDGIQTIILDDDSKPTTSKESTADPNGASPRQHNVTTIYDDPTPGTSSDPVADPSVVTSPSSQFSGVGSGPHKDSPSSGGCADSSQSISTDKEGSLLVQNRKVLEENVRRRKQNETENVTDNDTENEAQNCSLFGSCATRWNKLAPHEKMLWVALVILCLIAIIIATCAITSDYLKRQCQQKLAKKPSLISSCSDSYPILKNMDHSADPCEDFYQFVCGKFVDRALIPAEAASVSALSDMIDGFDALINTMIHEITPSAPRPFQLVKGFYQTCMNQSRVNELGDTTIRRIVSDLGGWPVVEGDNWNEDGFNWIESIYKMKAFGIHNNFFLTIGIQNDMKNNEKRIITVEQAALGLNGRLLTNYADPQDFAKSYFNYMVNVAVMFGADRKTAITELERALDFERSIARNFISMDQWRNKSSFYHSYTIGRLNKEKPGIDWTTLFRNIAAPDSTIDDNQIVIVAAPAYVDNLIEKINTTLNRTVANYVIWRAIDSCILYLHEPLRKLYFEAQENQTGISGAGERWKECTILTTKKLPLAVSSLYVRKYFPNEAKVDAQQMADNIHAEFLKILENVRWMDESTRSKAIKKVTAMTKHIGYPNELLDDKKLDKHYKSLRISQNDFLGSVLNITLFDTKFKFSRLQKPVNKKDWRDHGSVTVIDARHHMLENSIEIPAGILHGNMFDANRPRYMNYATIGVVIGHEITHGFDDEGRQFDQDGNLVQWWKNATSAKFVAKTRCFIDQHDSFRIGRKRMPSPGNITQGEVIADNGGTKIAYLAYQKWAAENPPEVQLPVLNYTTNQTFWITAASIWCTKHKPEVYNMISTHPLEHFRITGTLRNLEEFANDFQCRSGTAMNPERKCQIW